MAKEEFDDELDISQSEVRKIDRVPRKYTILEYLEPLFEKNLPRNTNKLVRYVASYHSYNLKTLETLYITDYPRWHDPGMDVQILFECTGADRATLQELVENIEKPDFYKIHKYFINAVNMIIIAIIRYYLKKNDKKSMAMMTYYLGYSLYWMAYTTSFKKFNPSEEVVVYTMNDITNKFKIKQEGSVNKWIFSMMNQVLTAQQSWLEDGADYLMMMLVDYARTKVGSSMNTLANQIYKNANNKNLILTGRTVTDEGGAWETESDSETIASLATQYTSKFFSEPVSEKALKVATYKVEVSPDEVRGAIRTIKDEPSNYDKVRKFYEAVFTLFFASKKYDRTEVNTLTFVAYMNNVYKKGNTADPHMLQIRDCLNEWLNTSSPLYRQLTRAATQSSFRKAIYFYMTYVVGSSN